MPAKGKNGETISYTPGKGWKKDGGGDRITSMPTNKVRDLAEDQDELLEEMEAAIDEVKKAIADFSPETMDDIDSLQKLVFELKSLIYTHYMLTDQVHGTTGRRGEATGRPTPEAAQYRKVKRNG